jgi:hypothetical protein
MRIEYWENLDKYQKKRVVISSIFIGVVLILLIGLIVRLIPKASCTDRVKNQNETGVDCGGVCPNKCAITAQKDLVVGETGFVESGSGDNFDIYAVITNPNQTLGSGKFSYQFTVKDLSGSVIATKSGTNFILPGDKKYIIEPNLSLKGVPAKIELAANKPDWIESNQYYEKPQLKVVNKNYNQITSGVGFAEATGLLKNESPLDFNSIKLDIILKDSQGKVVALNSTEMNTVQAGENRDFRALWPNRFSGDVANMEVQPEANIFASDAFVKKSFNQGQFQQY